MRKVKYLIDGKEWELSYVWWKEQDGWVQVTMWTADFARERIGGVDRFSLGIVEKGTSDQILHNFMCGDPEERKHITTQLVNILQLEDVLYMN